MTSGTGVDLSKSLFSEGSWHIVPAEHVNSWMSMDRNSVICHRCPEWDEHKLTPAGLAWEHTGYWATAGSTDVPCKLCGNSPPEAIARLFLLHNFDTFHLDGVGRSVSKTLNIAFKATDRAYCIGEHPEEIGDDR